MHASDCSPPGVLRVAQWVRIRWWNASAWYAVTLAEALARRGHASFVLAPEGTPAREEAARRGLPTPAVGDLGSLRPGEWFRAGRRTDLFLREEGIQLVNVHSSPGHARLALLCRRRGLPLVRTRSDIRPPRSGPYQRWLYGRGTTHHLASAEFIRREYYPALRVAPERVSTLHGAVDPSRLDRVPREEARRRVRSLLGLPGSAPLVGMVGRLSPVKGHLHFLNAMARLARGHAEVHLLVVGPEAQLSRADLMEVARVQGLGERTHIVGRVEDPLLWSAALDVAVIASVDSEAVCRSAFEFLGLGVPLVATRVHAIPEVVSEGAGLLVPPADPVSLAEAVALLLDSPPLRESFAAAGRAHVRSRFGLETFGLEAESLFRRLIDGNRSRTRRNGRAPVGPEAPGDGGEPR